MDLEIANAAVDETATHDLWIGASHVLTVSIPGEARGFPAQEEHLPALNRMIQDLARAAKAVIYHAENDTGVDTTFALQPIGAIAEAIILLSQLSEAVQSELKVTVDKA